MSTTLLRRAAGLGAAVLATGVITAAGPVQAAGPATFTNPAPIRVDAIAWQSRDLVVDLPGTITDVNVTLRKILADHSLVENSKLDDLDIYLQSPTGKKVWLISDACFNGQVLGNTYTFDDAATKDFPQGSVGCGGSAPFRPVNYDGGDNAAEPEGVPTTLASFNGSTASGTWKLFYRSDFALRGGLIQEGFTLDITTAPAVAAPETKVAKVKTKKRKVVIKLASDTAGVTFQNKVKSKAVNLDWQPTKKPAKVVGKNLRNGKTVIWVRAVDGAGNVDATPVKVKVKVLPNGTVTTKVKG